jgi:hypothetical protein
MRLPDELLPRDRPLTESDLFRVDAWTARHDMSWADREEARLRVRAAVNASPLIRSFSLRELNRPRVFRGTVRMMNWLSDGAVLGPYDSSVKISESVAAVNFRWHTVRTWLRRLRGQRILVLACGVAREVDPRILRDNDVTLVDAYPDKETARRLDTPIRRLNVFRDELPEYDVLVCLGLLDYVPAAKKASVMRRWESFGAGGSRMLVGQVRDTVDMKRIHVSMNWPLHTWPSERSPYAVYDMNATYYMMLKGLAPDELQAGLNGGTLRYEFTSPARSML